MSLDFRLHTILFSAATRLCPASLAQSSSLEQYLLIMVWTPEPKVPESVSRLLSLLHHLSTQNTDITAFYSAICHLSLNNPPSPTSSKPCNMIGKFHLFRMLSLSCLILLKAALKKKKSLQWICSLTVEYSNADLTSSCLVAHWLNIGPPKVLDILSNLLSIGDFKLSRPQITTVKTEPWFKRSLNKWSQEMVV